MFIQIIQGRAADPAQLRQSFDLWRQDLASAADGWLGTTAGIAGDDLAIAVIRFDSAEAAERNSARPEQHQWWMDTSKLFWGDVSFHDCRQVMTFLDGGSDQGGPENAFLFSGQWSLCGFSVSAHDGSSMM